MSRKEHDQMKRNKINNNKPSDNNKPSNNNKPLNNKTSNNKPSCNKKSAPQNQNIIEKFKNLLKEKTQRIK